MVGRADAVRGSGGAVEVDEEQPLLTDGGAGSDHDVRARVARGADVAGRQGVSVPGCCDRARRRAAAGLHRLAICVWAAREGTKQQREGSSHSARSRPGIDLSFISCTDATASSRAVGRGGARFLHSR